MDKGQRCLQRSFKLFSFQEQSIIARYNNNIGATPYTHMVQLKIACVSESCYLSTACMHKEAIITTL